MFKDKWASKEIITTREIAIIIRRGVAVVTPTRTTKSLPFL